MAGFTDGDVRNAVAFTPASTTRMEFSGAEAEKFDRWLREHDAKVWAEGYASGQDSVHTSPNEWPTPTLNPYGEVRA